MTCKPGCTFCKIINRDEACVQLYEDEHSLAFMDNHPANDGHCLVIPKMHYETIFEIPPEEFTAIARTAVRIAAGVQRALQPTGLSLVQANGASAGQSVMHIHMHVLPRREDDHLLMNWSRSNKGDPIYIAELAGRIRAQL
jgi:histidine triad (HIT) family protein